MTTKENNEKNYSRREFFKKAAKTTLPMIAVIALGVNPVKLKAITPNDCENSCENTCSKECSNSCTESCTNCCKGQCRACSGSCSDCCLGACACGCQGSCSGTCEGVSMGKSKPLCPDCKYIKKREEWEKNCDESL